MTKSLEIALERLKALPDEEQDSLAQLLLDEMDEDAKWDATTAKHADKLAKLTQEILAAHQRGECEPLDPESL
jgi:hypothetical protein